MILSVWIVDSQLSGTIVSQFFGTVYCRGDSQLLMWAVSCAPVLVLPSTSMVKQLAVGNIVADLTRMCHRMSEESTKSEDCDDL